MELAAVFADAEVYSRVLNAILRWAMPALTIILLFRCVRPLIFFRREPEIWAWLRLSDGSKRAVTHWENVIGRSKQSDIRIDLSTVSKTHAVLTRYADGSWSITDAESKGGVTVNGRKIDTHPLEEEDVIGIGGLEMTLQPISQKQEKRLAQLRTKGATVTGSFANVLLLTVIQLLFCVAYLLAGVGEYAESILLGFSGIVVLQWLLLVFYLIY